MQTLYFTTRNFVRSEGNVVDLAEYRRRLRLCSGYTGTVEADNVCWDADYDELEWDAFPAEEAPTPVPMRRKHKSAGFFALSNLPELCATLAVIVMAVALVIRFIQL